MQHISVLSCQTEHINELTNNLFFIYYLILKTSFDNHSAPCFLMSCQKRSREKDIKMKVLFEKKKKTQTNLVITHFILPEIYW